MFGLIPYTNTAMRRNYTTPFANEFFRSFFETGTPAGFRVDVKDEGDRYLMDAELPGIRKEDVKVTIENSVLTISANTVTENEQKTDNYVYRERRTGAMQRAFSLEGVNEDAITGEYKDGVLHLTLPKLTEAVPARREIAIN
ncbi:MAG: Hsp20/alpha crystallin family protein [Clostridia bacterium]|nr:Hsp20/alpha crystallin family protein [Clostridia bacterium]